MPLSPPDAASSPARLTRWRRVQLAVERDIRAGSLAPGERLPSEEELAALFAVHRNTVRRALEGLRERGLIRAEQGRGTFVRERVVPHTLGPTSKLSATLRELERVGERRVLGHRRLRADRAIADLLQVPPGQYLRRAEVLNLVDGRPVSVASVHWPLPRFNGIEQPLRATGSISAALRELGVVSYTRRETRITAAMPSRADAALLQQPRTRPVLCLTNINVDTDGVPIQVSLSRLSPRWLEVVIRFGEG